MEAAPPWLAELALAAASSTASARCAERFVEAAVRVAGARAVFVFATRREAGALELLAASAANSGAATTSAAVGGPAVTAFTAFTTALRYDTAFEVAASAALAAFTASRCRSTGATVATGSGGATRATCPARRAI